VRFRLRLLVLFLLLPPALRRRVAAPLRAAAERDAFEREREAARPDPLFLPPPSSLFTVAQARRSASRRETPRFSYPSSMCSAFRFCLFV
jgi:hypothetical protein